MSSSQGCYQSDGLEYHGDDCPMGEKYPYLTRSALKVTAASHGHLDSHVEVSCHKMGAVPG